MSEEKTYQQFEMIEFHEVQFVFIPKKEWRLIESEVGPYFILAKP